MRLIKVALFGCALLTGPAWATALSHGEATALASKVVELATRQGYNVSATVLDVERNALATVRSEQAGPYTPRASFKKAYTALVVRQPTQLFIRDTLQKQPEDLEKFIVANIRDSDHLIFLPGGVPIVKDGRTLGAIGVGGAPGGHLDDALAKHVLTDMGFTY
ncbi:GlcG/HbpS family heme-binding protein [Pseudomonas plecoglossicida]|nr:heme-binding protein [Pseudomonas plecoglossicida]EPB93856.1 hypothetical protein L321_21117 [Pseudomonas plecoglossicida NB2011]QLB55293.1 heme-binding protein [Pseudomonas plecoglossicida]GLR35054.1 hypothetical protein GCM10011247_04510 [Pseudomonas plecoglossicida]